MTSIAAVNLTGGAPHPVPLDTGTSEHTVCVDDTRAPRDRGCSEIQEVLTMMTVWDAGPTFNLVFDVMSAPSKPAPRS
jgi:hypothetical protein